MSRGLSLAISVAALALVAVPPVAAASSITSATKSALTGRRLVVGVRHYRTPGAALMLPPVLDSPPAQSGGLRVPRLRAADHPGAYRPRALSPPRKLAHNAARTSAVSLYSGSGFPGLVDNGFWPADAQVAVGTLDIVEMTNTMVGVYERSGLRLALFPISNILGNTSDELVDPQVAWDPTTGLWLASAMDLTTNTTEVAVSDGPDPREGWFDYSFAYGSKLCPDQPRLGFSSLVVVVAVELFNDACHSSAESGVAGGVVLVIDKQALLEHAGDVPADQYGPDINFSNYVPVQMLAPSQVEYFAATDSPSSKVVHVFVLQGVPPSDSLNLQDTLLISTLRDPTFAAQRGGGVVDAGDDRVNDASWQAGVLYLAADDRCTYPKDRYLETCARVMEISTTGPRTKLIGENDIGFPNGDAYYAAVRPDANGNLIVLFGYSTQHEYPSLAALAAVGPIVGEQGGNFTDPIELAGGTSPTVQRWGDYQGAAVDPTNPSVIWTVGQVSDDFGSEDPHRWATHIDSVSLTGSLPGALPHQVAPGYHYRGQTSQRHNLSILPSGGGGHIASVNITLGLRCRQGKDIVSFDLDKEAHQSISFAGHFHFRTRFGSDSYATSYSVTLYGVFTAGHVTGHASASERSRKLGRCRARRISFSAYD